MMYNLPQDVIAHWMDLINGEGWIPREQILGDEARSKVPLVGMQCMYCSVPMYVF